MEGRFCAENLTMLQIKDILSVEMTRIPFKKQLTAIKLCKWFNQIRHFNLLTVFN